MVSSQGTEVYQEEFEESTTDALPEVPSLLSTLPVALVVEQTARILEDIKKKIQLQKEEEERQKLEQQNRSQSPTFFTLSRSVRAPSSDDGIFSTSTTKSFIILNHRYSDSAAPPKNLSPLNNTSIPRSLSPDSGTDYEPFSASSSISPPFLSTTKNNNLGSNSDVMKLSHNSDDEIFKPISSFSSFMPSTAPPKLNTISPTTSLSSIHSSVRRLSGITMSHPTTTSLAKSTPSISTDLIKEAHFKPIPTSTSDPPRPLSFQVLQTNFNFDTNSIDTYHEAAFTSLDPISGGRHKSLANLPLMTPTTTATIAPLTSWIPSLPTSTTITTSKLTGLLNSSSRLTFGDPNAIKPIVSALEYPTFKLPTYSFSTELKTAPEFPTRTLDNHAKSFDETLTRSTTLEKYNEFVEKQKLQIELNQQQRQEYPLSLSLSPPMNRRSMNMPALKGCSSSL
ncbi:CLUMA_CG020566, isoform A [Clunio marinus]|uniref:CLUMA_CG020566, isoform A n=1 Tax=Clunio marinus TaxID=568069 RepID=A0A1J1J9B8_9DIPT|nr:CLUMA_CG020566, isoform A [Clunio marinus]